MMKHDPLFYNDGSMSATSAGGSGVHPQPHQHLQPQLHSRSQPHPPSQMPPPPHVAFGSGDSMLEQIQQQQGAGSMPDLQHAQHQQQHAMTQMYPSVYTNLGGSASCGGGGVGAGGAAAMHPMFGLGPAAAVHHHHLQAVSMAAAAAMANQSASQPAMPPTASGVGPGGGATTVGAGGLHCVVGTELDCDPRELEAFAEHFKQRRIKLGATQADVGSALGKLKLPGVGSLSQSTICRFESLTLSHNNMVALKPILHAWLIEAERAARETKMRDELLNGGTGAGIDRKRKRTSIAAPEKRSLEAYFAIQPRPSGEKIAQIADKLDLKKNVVRVWFCNQRQKQKRMKFSAATLRGPQ